MLNKNSQKTCRLCQCANRLSLHKNKGQAETEGADGAGIPSVVTGIRRLGAVFVRDGQPVSGGAAGSGQASARSLLARCTANPAAGLLTGAAVTAVLQSSSAVTVMVIAFLAAGLLQLRQAVPVVFGANIGTTVTAQLLAFRVESWRYLLLFCGVLLCLACKNWRGRCVGEAVFGFGLLFEGVTVMRSAMEPLLQSPLLRLELARVQQSPLHGLLAGVCMTLTVQSSSATVALLQSMAAQPGADGVHSLLGLTAAIPILLGDNIGTTVTAVLAAIGQGRDAKRVAAAHAIFNLSGAAVCCALLQPFAALVRLCSPTGAECAVIARQIANAHTLFNGLCALVWSFDIVRTFA